MLLSSNTTTKYIGLTRISLSEHILVYDTSTTNFDWANSLNEINYCPCSPLSFFSSTQSSFFPQLDEIYQNTSGFIGSRVESFRSGSIIANFILIFTRTSSITEVEANEIFKSALTSDAEITSGSGLFLTSIDAFNISCEFF